MKKYFLLVLISLVPAFLVMAQNNPYDRFLPQIKVPNASAFQFMRYGEIPLDYSTGVPKIEIPLYILKTKDLDIPISISYHASGNKVLDIASPVGLGWTLSAGGVIFQTRYGESSNEDLADQTPFSSASEARSMLSEKYDSNYWVNFVTNNSINDNISDRYYYNFSTFSGVFRMDIRTKQIKTIPYSPLKIERIGSDFTIKDTEGRIWYFQRMWTGATIEYYLRSIQFPGIEDKVEFSYGSESIYSIVTPIESVHYGRSENIATLTNYICELPYTKTYSHSRQYGGITNTSSGITLTSIKWKETQILFDYSNDRKDPMRLRLNNILIKHGSSQVRKILFHNKDQYFGDVVDNYRMLLRGLDVEGEKYLFGYKEDISMPAYHAYNYPLGVKNISGDFWGYFNGYYGWDEIVPFEWTDGTGRMQEEQARRYKNNREANPMYSQAGIIQEIIYPSGGKTIFHFEQNKGVNVYQNDLGRTNNHEEEYFGGLRVKSIINMQGEDTLNIRTYEYKGGPTDKISRYHFVYGRYTYYNMLVNVPIFLYGYLIVESQMASASILGLPSRLGVPPVHYHTVLEYFKDSNQNYGKKEYFYDVYPYPRADECGTFEDFVGPRYLFNYYGCDYGEQRAKVKAIKEYEWINGVYELRKETNNEYSHTNKGSFITGVEFNHLFNFVNFSNPGGYFANGPVGQTKIDFLQNFYISDSYGIQDMELLSSSTVKEYRKTNTVSSTTNYFYDEEYRLLSPVQKTIVNSDGEISKEVLTHPFNYNISPYVEMTNNGVISPVVSQKKIIGSSCFTLKNNYKKIGFKFLKDEIMSGKDDILESRIRYINYDIMDNPVYLLKDSGTHIVYLWAYKKQYPVAKIEGLAYSQIESILTSSFIDTLSNNSSVSLSTCDFIRNSLKAFGALVTTYTYKPLVGMTSSTAPDGVTTYYGYDSLGRLQENYLIKNGSKKNIQSYDYHYVNH